jgi:hypothetical protein
MPTYGKLMKETGVLTPSAHPALEKLVNTMDLMAKNMAGWQHQFIHDFLLLRGKAPREKR